MLENQVCEAYHGSHKVVGTNWVSYSISIGSSDKGAQLGGAGSRSSTALPMPSTDG